MHHLSRVQWFALAMSLAQFIYLVNLADFPKQLVVYPDELRYIHLNDSLVNDGSLMVRGVENNFTKVLYSLALFPAAFFVGGANYTTAVAVLNSAMMACVPLLTASLARSCGLGWISSVFLVVLSIFLPDNMYVLSFMSENLYFPLAIFAVLMAWGLMGERGKNVGCMAAGFGVMVYLLYMTKEIGVAFLLSYVILFIWKGRQNREALRGAFCALIAFSVLYVIMKLTVFSGMSSVYTEQMVNKAGSYGNALIYLIHVYGIHLVWSLLAFFFFPVVIPLVYWHELDQDTKYRWGFLILCLLIVLGVVAVVVTLPEDYPRMDPRQHLRYISYLFLPFAALSLQVMETMYAQRQRMNKKCLIGILLLFLTGLLCIKMPFHQGCHVDQTMLKYMISFSWKGSAEQVGIGILFALLGGLFLKGDKAFLVALGLCVLTVCGINSAKTYKEFHATYEVSAESVAEYSLLSAFLAKHDGKIWYMAKRDKWYEGTCMLDTYLPNRLLYTQLQDFSAVSENDMLLIDERILSELNLAQFDNFERISRCDHFSLYRMRTN